MNRRELEAKLEIAGKAWINGRAEFPNTLINYAHKSCGMALETATRIVLTCVRDLPVTASFTAPDNGIFKSGEMQWEMGI